MGTYHTDLARSAASAVGFILYVVVGSAALTNLVSGSVASHAVEPPGLMASARYPQVEPISKTLVVVGISIADADSEGQSPDSLDVLCTTSKGRIAADWIVVPAADFAQVDRELGCEPRAE